MGEGKIKIHSDDVVPYPHQLESVKWLYTRFKKREALILGSVMGTGKSGVYVMLTAAKKTQRVLVVCPGGAKGVVEAEFEKWSPRPLNIQVILSGNDILDPDANVIVCSYDLCYRPLILRQLTSLEYDMIIYEEAHNLGSRDAKRARACLANLWPKTSEKLFVTGSVTRNKIINLYPILRRCIPEKVKNIKQFQQDNCNAIPGKFGTKYDGLRKDAPIVRERWLQEVMIRHGKEVLKDLPPKTERKVKLRSKELDDLIDRQAENDFKEIPDRDEFLPAQYAKARSELGLIKVPAVMEFIDYWLEENSSPLVLACYHRHVWEAYRQELAKRNLKTVGIIGGDNSKKRDQAVRSFQAGEARIFLATFAASEAITLVKASTLIFAEMSFSLAGNEQFMDRVHRIGQLNPATIYFLITNHFIDKAIWSSYKSKSRVKAKVIGSA